MNMSSKRYLDRQVITMRKSFSERIDQISKYINVYKKDKGQVPSLDEIANHLKLSRSTVKGYLKYICEIGLLS